MKLAGTLGLIGCGHIGGSLAKAVRAAGAVGRVVGFDPAWDAEALSSFCDEIADTEGTAVAQADLVVLAVPLRGIAHAVARVAPFLKKGAVVTDVGSTKQGIVTACEAILGEQARFVGAHPLAGTERSGPMAADPKLFAGRLVFVTPTSRTDKDALALVEATWEAVGASIRHIPADLHDQIMAALSHLPHVAAYGLVGALYERGVGDLCGMGGSGFTDTTRVASTRPATWVDIFLENRAALLPLIDRLVHRITALGDAIAAGDADKLEQLLAEGKHARERILGA
ncbi:MAG: prephenate dehydrogenase [Deltaproteobacteria bacterium]|nr:prephenate dehydrogenase [Deltaproteobacteria bacterium]